MRTIRNIKQKRNKKIKKRTLKNNNKNQKNNKQNKFGGAKSYPPLKTDAEIYAFWSPFFQNMPINPINKVVKTQDAITNINNFKSQLQQLLNTNNSCNIIKSTIRKYAITEKAKRFGYENQICFINVLFGLLSYIMKDKCTIMITGGKAVQLALSNMDPQNTNTSSNYASDDIDVIIIPKSITGVSTGIIPKEYAEQIAGFINWITVINNKPMLSIEQNDITLPMAQPPVESLIGSIVKISLPFINASGRPGFFAIADIGYILPEHSNIFHEFQQRIYFDINIQTFHTNGFFTSVDAAGLVLEKLHYIIKYISPSSMADSTQNKFRASLHKSINVLLDQLLIQKIKQNPPNQVITKDTLIKDYFYIYMDKFDMEELPDDITIEQIIQFITTANTGAVSYSSVF